MKAHDDVSRYIEEWDEEVLQYVADIDVAYTHEQQVGGCSRGAGGVGRLESGAVRWMLFAVKHDCLL